jgi:serine/threonine protein kinase
MSSPLQNNKLATTSQLPPPPKQVEQVGDYIIQEKIGQGSFATVYKAQHKVSVHSSHFNFLLQNN